MPFWMAEAASKAGRQNADADADAGESMFDGQEDGTEGLLGTATLAEGRREAVEYPIGR